MSLVISGSGHRPKYFPDAYNMESDWVKEIEDNLRNELAIREPDVIISGMAIGWDMLFAHAGIELGIPVRAYIPFPNQQNMWPRDAQQQYEAILEEANAVFMCSQDYHRECFHKRDRLMVDHSDEVFALWNPLAKSGGTYYTVNYAEKHDKTVTNFWKD